MWMRATKPFLSHRDSMPDESTRKACDEIDRLVAMWNKSLGRNDENADDDAHTDSSL